MTSATHESGKRLGTPWSRVTAITVTYNSSEVIAGCLKSVEPAARVIVVDNASSDNAPALAGEALPSAEIIRNESNVGFGRGNNIALDRTDTEFALLINPDARMIPGAIEALVAAADLFPEGALFAPAMMTPDGTRRFGHDARFDVQRRLPRRRDEESDFAGPFCTWSLSGAVMLLRMAHMRDIGFFDRNIFLYYEDSDLCERIRRAGRFIVQEPRARAEHIEGSSSLPSARSTWIRNQALTWARLYFIEKHYRSRAAWLDMAKMLPVYLYRSLAYSLTLRGHKALGYLARAAGMVIWAVRRPRSSQGD